MCLTWLPENCACLQPMQWMRTHAVCRFCSYQQRMQTACAPVELTKIRDDPYVHFGDVVQLLHVNTGCLLAVDVEDKVGAYR